MGPLPSHPIQALNSLLFMKHLQGLLLLIFVLLGSILEQSALADTPPTILMLIPGGDSFDSSAGLIYHQFREWGYNVHISIPRDQSAASEFTAPNARAWQSAGIPLSDESSGQGYNGYLPIAQVDPSNYAALFVLGGEPRTRPPKAPDQLYYLMRDPLRLFVDSQTAQEIIRVFHKDGKPIGALSHGVEILAKTRPSEVFTPSMLWTRYVTGPNYTLDFRHPLVWLGLWPGAQKTGDKIRAVLRTPDRQFIHGPSRLSAFIHGLLTADRSELLQGGFVVAHRNLVTGRSARDAMALAQKVHTRIVQPQRAHFKEFFVPVHPFSEDSFPKSISLGKKRSIRLTNPKIWVEVFEVSPVQYPKADILIHHDMDDDPRNYVDFMLAMREQGFRVICYSLPHHGKSFGFLDGIPIWGLSSLSSIGVQIEEALRTDDSIPLIEMGVGLGSQMLIRRSQESWGNISRWPQTAREPAAYILISPTQGVPIQFINLFGFLQEEKMASNPFAFAVSPQNRSVLDPRKWGLRFASLFNALPMDAYPMNPHVKTFVVSGADDAHFKNTGMVGWISAQRTLGGPHIEHISIRRARHRVLQYDYAVRLHDQFADICTRALGQLKAP